MIYRNIDHPGVEVGELQLGAVEGEAIGDHERDAELSENEEAHHEYNTKAITNLHNAIMAQMKTGNGAMMQLMRPQALKMGLATAKRFRPVEEYQKDEEVEGAAELKSAEEPEGLLERMKKIKFGKKE